MQTIHSYIIKFVWYCYHLDIVIIYNYVMSIMIYVSFYATRSTPGWKCKTCTQCSACTTKTTIDLFTNFQLFAAGTIHAKLRSLTKNKESYLYSRLVFDLFMIQCQINFHWKEPKHIYFTKKNIHVSILWWNIECLLCSKIVSCWYI